MSVFDETWSAEGGHVRVPHKSGEEWRDGFFGYVEGYEQSDCTVELEYDANEEDKARARLAAAAPEMYRLLLAVGCVPEGHGLGCQFCGSRPGREGKVHRPECPWASVMKKARAD